MLKNLIIIFLWFTFYSIQSLPQVLTTEKLYQKVLPSIATLEVQKNNGDIVLGTAFLIKNDGVAVTCFHVIKDAKVVNAKFSDGEEFLASGLIDKDEKRDLAVIKIKCYKENTLSLSKEEPKVGASAFVIGSPKGLEFSISDGIVSQVQTFEGSKQYQFTCPASPGNSGGPLLNNKGEVIGVVSWQVSQGQNLNFAVPSSYVLGLDQSLPTTPWSNITYVVDNASNNSSDSEYLKTLASLHESDLDLFVSFQEIWITMMEVDGGFRKTIPSPFYSSLLKISSAINKLNILSPTDPEIKQAASVIISTAEITIKAAETLREAIDVAKSNNGWTDKANDLISQSIAYTNTYDKSRAEATKYLSQFNAFTSSLSEDTKVMVDGRNDSLGFRLNIYFYSDHPTKLTVVVEDGLGSTLGFENGDEILSINSVPVKTFYELKKAIFDNRGRYLTFEIKRDGDKKTFTRDIPNDLSKYKD